VNAFLIYVAFLFVLISFLKPVAALFARRDAWNASDESGAADIEPMRKE